MNLHNIQRTKKPRCQEPKKKFKEAKYQRNNTKIQELKIK